MKAFLEGLRYFLRKQEAISDGLGDAGIAEVGHWSLVSKQRLGVLGYVLVVELQAVLQWILGKHLHK